MTEAEFEALEKTHVVVANGWNSQTGADVTVLGTKQGTPIAIRYMSTETGGDFVYQRIQSPVVLEHEG